MDGRGHEKENLGLISDQDTALRNQHGTGNWLENRSSTHRNICAAYL